MERRVALKNMGLAFGYTIVAPTLLGIVQSCSTKKVLDWTPDFFTKDEGVVLHTLVDMILPKTDTPSATEVNVHVFIDKFVNEVLPKEHQDFLKNGMDKFMNTVLTVAQKETLAELGEEDLEPTLAKYLKKRTDAIEESHEKAVEDYFIAVKENGSAIIDDEIAHFSFATSLRDMAIWSYKTSEYVGEEVLAYLPVPGEYIACEDEQTLTQGKAWSL
ncbi:gluconate 2-dehydrogenase subunit 3 family protein [Flagellimonas sp. HMM57]|uniref:gluconate 2-dehydrogenase subunit 3 family protein n=1 Tax=unclassified Flagellimonas TaxID=2644544 RepID=UPI0013D1EEBE|nr:MULTISPECIES: gluconate 2-dehydrogenase subunit 3 family protein [unclassified Flagellimonas]UII77439.1 gluconate 2-dehydrogenase subunit 3 family protein [Flagellimonas sp. HMM57]